MITKRGEIVVSRAYTEIVGFVFNPPYEMTILEEVLGRLPSEEERVIIRGCVINGLPEFEPEYKDVCYNCGNEDLENTFNYCPECGCKL